MFFNNSEREIPFKDVRCYFFAIIVPEIEFLMSRHVPNIELLRKGDKREFEKIYSEFAGVLYALGYQHLKSRAIAEEMVQEAFLKLWEFRLYLKPDTNIRNYLYTITRNTCLNHLRNEQIAARHINNVRFQETRLAEQSLLSSGQTYAEFEELRKKLGEAIANLPPDLREVFELNRFEGLTYKEIAIRMDLSEKAIEARISKALKILRTHLKDYLPLLALLTANSFPN